MTNKLARGFDTVLMRYLPQLLCFEVKPNCMYTRVDYMRLLVNSSVLNAYAEGMSNVSNKLGAGVPNADTALMYFKSIDRYELQSVVSIVLEEQVVELKRKGLLKRPVPIAFDWHDQMFYGDHYTAEMVNGTRPKDGSSYAYQYLTASILVDGKRLTIVLTPIKSREHIIDYVKDALNRIRKEHGRQGEVSPFRRRILFSRASFLAPGERVHVRHPLHPERRDEEDGPQGRGGRFLSILG